MRIFSCLSVFCVVTYPTRRHFDGQRRDSAEKDVNAKDATCHRQDLLRILSVKPHKKIKCLPSHLPNWIRIGRSSSYRRDQKLLCDVMVSLRWAVFTWLFGWLAVHAVFTPEVSHQSPKGDHQSLACPQNGQQCHAYLENGHECHAYPEHDHQGRAYPEDSISAMPTQKTTLSALPSQRAANKAMPIPWGWPSVPLRPRNHFNGTRFAILFLLQPVSWRTVQE